MIIDVFLYCGEAEMAKVRVRELTPYVDLFLLAEADFTFSGLERKLSFPAVLEELRSLARLYRPARPPRIVAFPLLRDSAEGRELEKGCPDPWAREAFCRDQPRREVQRLLAESGAANRKDDLIFVSDCDEIPDFRRLDKQSLPRKLRERGPLCLSMDFYYYNFSSRKKSQWPGTLVVSGSQLDLSWEDLRRRRAELPSLPSGWHLSYFMSPERMAEKIRGFSHQEFNLPGLNEPAVLAERVARKQDVFGRGHWEDLLAVDPLKVTLPRTYFYFPGYMKGE